MSEASQGDDRHIAIRRDVIGSAIVIGNRNKVVIYNYHLDRQVEIETKPSTSHLAANPYRGLAAFQVEDANVYFGREAQIDRLWNRLRELQERAVQDKPPVRLLPILGASGSGKSSLARAGLLPELARRPLPGYQQTYVAIMKPGKNPLEGLARVLARIATNDPSPSTKRAEFEAILRQSGGQGAHDQLRKIVNDIPCLESSPLVILIDQLEEIYSLCKDANERAIFIDNLIEAASSAEARVSVVITMRLDFAGETQRHPLLNQIIGSDQSVILPVMTLQELHRAIAEPARQARHPLDEGVVDRLIEQTEGREGALPLLQFTLTSIWEGLEQGKSPTETLKAIGGVGGALAGEAQRIYSNLSAKEKDIARRVFIGLVELGEGTRDTRRRATIDSLVSAQDKATLVREVMGRFSVPGARLLTLSSVEGKEVAEVTHEALLDHWQQIREWLDGQRDRIRQQRRINALAEEWEKQGKKRGYLLQGRQLDDARSFQKRYAETLPLTECAAEFVRKSVQQRWLNRAAVASFLILPLLVVDSFLREEAIQRNYVTLDSEDISGKPEAVKALTKGCGHLQPLPDWFKPMGERIFGACRTLRRKKLAKTYLSGADLSGVDLSDANLSHADLSRADLSRAHLSHADLREANLSHANLSHANLSGVDLSGVDLSDTDLSNLDLREANLSGVDLSDANLSHANLSRADLGGAHLYNANLSGAHLSDANLSDANFHDANLSSAHLSYADLREANLSGADLSDALLYDADLGGARLYNADLSRAILLAINLSNSKGLEQPQLSNSEDSPLLCHTKLPAELKHLADRDCDRLPQMLLERSPNSVKNLEDAKDIVERSEFSPPPYSSDLAPTSLTR
ncbi:MAG TPA: pentapeptide repeat-containing protein [Trichocoleus sp.]